eukprot:6211985-Pleurochrysis_carterae.AAC.4
MAGNDGHAQAATSHLGSGARALRKYTCDARQKRQTVHTSGTAARGDGFKCSSARQGQNAK